MLDNYITFTNTSISSTEDAHRTAYTKDNLSPEPFTSPPKKKSKTTFKSQVVDLEEDEE
jgi:hypothetical protein